MSWEDNKKTQKLDEMGLNFVVETKEEAQILKPIEKVAETPKMPICQKRLSEWKC
jgi:hypothetical protein